MCKRRRICTAECEGFQSVASLVALSHLVRLSVQTLHAYRTSNKCCGMLERGLSVLFGWHSGSYTSSNW